MIAAVYIMASKRNGTLYTGVTSDLARRAFEHRNNLLPGFTRDYDCKQLVWFEQHDDIRLAIQREKNIKHWYRKWKLELIETMNADWNDLYPDLIASALGSRVKPENDDVQRSSDLPTAL